MDNLGEFEWGDITDNGEPWTRNEFMLCNLEDECTDKLCGLPFGYGVSVFDLGEQKDWLSPSAKGVSLRDYTEKIVSRMAQVIQQGTPLATTVQLGAVHDSDLPLSETTYKHMMLLVWSHDPSSLEDLKACVHQNRSLFAERGNKFTIKDFMDLPLLNVCYDESRKHRAGIALRTLKAIGLPALQENLSPTGDEIYDSINFETVRFRNDADGEGTVHVLNDCNHPSTGGVVFHSPSRGSTLYMPCTDAHKRGCHSGILASDGRHMVLPPTQVVQTPTEPRLYYSRGYREPGTNVFKNVNEFEGTFKKVSEMAYSAAFQHCEKIQMKAVATAFPAPVSPSGKLYGHIEMSTIQHILQNLDMEEEHVYIDNLPAWQKQLWEADTEKRPFYYMNEHTAVCGDDHKTVIKYKLSRTSLETE